MKLTILNTREQKEIYGFLKDQWGFTEKLDYVFLLSAKGKIYLAKKSVFDVDLDKLNVSSVGMYFGEVEKDGLRVSIEGSQLIGPKASKGIVEVDDFKEWMSGGQVECDEKLGSYVLVRCNGDYLGCGKAKEGKVLNYVGKVRRLH
tara:strand:+ start:395 stop:832 length:438 start_codon:yes stop_codon:yes gene_type:complete